MPSTVVVKTVEPAPGLLSILSLFPASIVPKDYGGMSAKEFAQHPVGTGPFELHSWTRGQSMTLLPNPHYWRENLPYVDQLVVHSVPQDNSRVAQLRSGELLGKCLHRRSRFTKQDYVYVGRLIGKRHNTAFQRWECAG